MRRDLILLSAAAALSAAVPQALAGPNDFFGSTMPGGAPSASNPPPTGNAGMGGAGDYSDDEKRMQKKYKANMQRYKDLISKGESMMKKGESSHNDKLFKRGKILKEIGERNLSELQANNPFPDIKKDDKKDGSN